MRFSHALELLYKGQRVTREKWVRDWATSHQPDEGGAPVLVPVPGSTITVAAGRPLGEAVPQLVGQEVAYGPHIDMVTGTQVHVWTPQQADMFATDWAVVS